MKNSYLLILCFLAVGLTTSGLQAQSVILHEDFETDSATMAQKGWKFSFGVVASDFITFNYGCMNTGQRLRMENITEAVISEPTIAANYTRVSVMLDRENEPTLTANPTMEFAIYVSDDSTFLNSARVAKLGKATVDSNSCDSIFEDLTVQRGPVWNRWNFRDSLVSFFGVKKVYWRIVDSRNGFQNNRVEVYIDNFRVIGTPLSCDPPTGLAVTATNVNSLDLSYSSASAGGLGQFEITLDPQDCASPTVVDTVSSTSPSIGGLVSGVSYNVSVLEFCSGGISAASGTVTAATDTACLVPLSLGASNATTTTVDIGWAIGGSANHFEVLYGPTGFDPCVAGTMDTTSNTTISLGSLTPNTAYDYYVRQVCASDNSPWNGAKMFNTLSTGLVDLSLADQLRISPNPAKDQLKIDWNGTGQEAKLSIYDMQGSKLREMNLKGTGQEVIDLDLANWQQGIYLIELRTATESVQQRIHKH